jgi:protoheme IX farnesyltransferase
MLPVRDEKGDWVASWSLVNAILLLGVSVLPYFLGLTTIYYGIVAASAGLWFCWKAVVFMRPGGREVAARKLFFTSIIYLPIIKIALVVDRVVFF